MSGFSLAANRAASFTRFSRSAPTIPGVDLAIFINFTSLDLLEIGKKYFEINATNDLNSIHPIYIDYINAN